MNPEKIAIVLPVYNEEAGVEKLAANIEKSLDRPVELVFVDDGSADNTLNVLKQYNLQRSENTKRVVVLSRNFGHQQAVMAGLTNVSDDADFIVVMDADGQDDPDDIPTLIDKIREGYDCVYAERTANSGNILIDALTWFFYRLHKVLFSIRIPEHAGTFSIFNRKFMHVMLQFKESEVYFPGLRAYVGMKQAGVPVLRKKRAVGTSKVRFIGLLRLSKVGIMGFSAAPLRAIFLCGVSITLLCVVLGIVVFVLKVTGITQIPGVTTVLLVIFGLFGIQMSFLGIIGEYVGKLHIESKKRPPWLIKEIIDEQ